MSVLDRLAKAQITAPDGSVHTFAYTDLARSVSHRIGSFEFSGIDGTLHQDKGVSGEVYPLKCIFYGDDYDSRADAFFDALKVSGNCELQHPRWGNRRVQIISGPSQAEAFVTGIGQAVFDVEFQESLQREFPETSPAARFEVPNNIDNFLDAFNFAVVADTLSDKNALKQEMLKSIGWVSDALGGPDVSVLTDTAETDIDDYLDTPDDFVSIISEAIRLPATSSNALGYKLEEYSRLLDSVTGADTGTATRSNKNNYYVRELVGSCAVAGVAESINSALGNTAQIARTGENKSTIIPATTDGFRTRAEVLSAAVFLRDSVGALITALDAGQVVFRASTLSDAYVQALDNYDPLTAITAKVIQSALNLSFSLPSERIRTLDSESTLINECYELYGNIDDATLDYFILTNGLTGEELLQLPRGKQVKYYV